MLKDLVTKSRSYRGYNENRKVTREELLELVECARLCPSSVNAQPFCYYLAWEKEEVDKIQALTNWARALPQMKLPHPGKCPTAFIIILQDITIGESLARYQKDVGIVAQTMLLAATEMGLGGCDIISDLAGELTGSLGLGPAINTNDHQCMAQAAHGSAPDIAGRNIANPVGIMLSAVMMFEWLADRYEDEKLQKVADLMQNGVLKTMEEGYVTPDLGGEASTSSFAQAIAEKIKNA